MKVWLLVMQKRPLELLPPTLSLASLLILSWWKWFLHSTTRSEKRHRSIHRQGLWLSHPTAAAGAGLMHGDGSRQEHRALPSAPALCGVSWASQGWEVPAWPTQFCRETQDKVNLARFKRFTLAVDGAEVSWGYPHTLTPPWSGLLLAKGGPHWVLPKTSEQGHCHGKRAADRTCTGMHSTPQQLWAYRAMRMTNVTVWDNSVTTSSWDARALRSSQAQTTSLICNLDIKSRYQLILIMSLVVTPQNSQQLILAFGHSIWLWQSFTEMWNYGLHPGEYTRQEKGHNRVWVSPKDGWEGLQEEITILSVSFWRWKSWKKP